MASRHAHNVNKAGSTPAPATLHSTEDKPWWCLHGNRLEEKFVKIISERTDVTASINPDKRHNKYAPDLIVGSWLADLKTQNTPFFTADKYSVNPQYAVTFNRKDYERYTKTYPGIHIYFWIDWQTLTYGTKVVHYMHGIYGITFRRLSQLILEAPEHFYKKRIDDKTGNAKSSFILDVRQFKKINIRAQETAPTA